MPILQTNWYFEISSEQWINMQMARIYSAALNSIKQPVSKIEMSELINEGQDVSRMISYLQHIPQKTQIH